MKLNSVKNYMNWSSSTLRGTLALLLIFVAFSACFLSCGSDDEDEPTGSPTETLYGVWDREVPELANNMSTPWKTIITINPNGTFSCTTFITGSVGQGGCVGPGKITLEFHYEIIGNTIKLSRASADGSISECTLRYKIEGNLLTFTTIAGPTLSNIIFIPADIKEATYTRLSTVN